MFYEAMKKMERWGKWSGVENETVWKMKPCGKWSGEENGLMKKIGYTPFYNLVNKLDSLTASTKKAVRKTVTAIRQ